MVFVISDCHFTLSHRCMFRVLDSFGTYVEFNFPGYRLDVAVLWGHQNLIPTQFMTLYRKCSGISWSKYSMVSYYLVMLVPMNLFAQLPPTLRENCPYSELFWSVFPRIRTEYGKIQSIYSFSIRMRENTDQKNLEYGHFSRSTILC